MSSNINDYVRPTDKSSRRDINKILSLIHDLVAQEPESEGLQQRISFTPHVKRRTSTVTFGSTTVSNTDDRTIENFVFTKRVPPTVSVYPHTHTTTGTLSFTGDATKLGGGATFDGSSYVTIPSHSEFDLSQFSMGGWFYLPATDSGDSASQNLMTKGVYELTIDPHSTASNQLRGRVNVFSTDNLVTEAGTILQTEDSVTLEGDTTGDKDVTYAFNADAWNHIWLTYSSTVGTKLYLNNSLVASDATSIGTLQTNSDNLVIG
jgi:hypothetical protein